MLDVQRFSQSVQRLMCRPVSRLDSHSVCFSARTSIRCAKARRTPWALRDAPLWPERGLHRASGQSSLKERTAFAIISSNGVALGFAAGAQHDGSASCRRAALLPMAPEHVSEVAG